MLDIQTHDQAKAYARILRAELAKLDRNISHAQALELAAINLGHANWNVLSAKLSEALSPTPKPGDVVSGTYLKQPFVGNLRDIERCEGSDGWVIGIDFTTPVDVVCSSAFSNMRRRVRGMISKGGVSAHKTSDGIPHLIVTTAGDRPH
ncbi:MAG: glyoxalase superfamily protein [Pseudomonadota bacterium]